MNENEQIEEHYMDCGYSYPVPEGFMGFFGDVSAAPLHYVNMGTMHEQESAYWSMHMNTYRFELSGSESTSYYGHYENNDNNVHGMDFSTRAWEYPSMATVQEPIAIDIPVDQDTVVAIDGNLPSEHNTLSVVHSTPEDRSPHHQDAVSTQILLQDDIDPDTMTYEELLGLGEAVGTESRGLSQDLIDLLPTSKHKSGSLFSRKKSEERCVICQMRYKRGDRQINLPCKHVYHTECGSKWLSINKTCPICNTEVFADESRS